ncbi:hypothetical protein F2Q69_00014601 [Brassica cretica]|uniref:Uncharacterized protein n=1 Tax=Brassica cretica TaxID=69181 RepID=A0A8S9QZQ0_BRACR|nr:hypothetical protein F2Q69_00014601 [Brassica cretica]
MRSTSVGSHGGGAYGNGEGGPGGGLAAGCKNSPAIGVYTQRKLIPLIPAAQYPKLMTTTPISKYFDEPSRCVEQNNESFLKLVDFVWKHGEVWSYGGGERGRAGGGTVEVDQKSKGKYKVTVEELMAEVELLEVDIKVVLMKEVVSGYGGSGGGYGGRRGGSGSYGSGYGSCGGEISG